MVWREHWDFDPLKFLVDTLPSPGIIFLNGRKAWFSREIISSFFLRGGREGVADKKIRVGIDTPPPPLVVSWL